MEYLELTFPTPAENLACDEALLDAAEAGQGAEVLRFWEAQNYFVVVGHANHVAREVNLTACTERGIPVYRRCTGGGAVLLGPGCLNYALILQIQNDALENVAQTNRFVMQRNCDAIATVLREIKPEQSWSAPCVCGSTDLAIGNMKFSGNSQRRRRRFLLFHGTFLLRFEINLMNELLLMPSHQPTYRENRAHSAFLTNLDLPAEAIKTALRNAWNATVEAKMPFLHRIHTLVAQKYSTKTWNFKF